MTTEHSSPPSAPDLQLEKAKLVSQWQRGLRIRHISHAKSHSRYNKWNRIVGFGSAVLSALVATAIFSSSSDGGEATTNEAIEALNEERSVMLIAGIISILATLFSSAASFLKLGELAAQHNLAVASYGQLRRDLELEIVQGIDDADMEKLQAINARWSELEQNTPAIPSSIFEMAKRQVSGEGLHSK